jgi:two-component system OmpR family response regulator
MMNPAHILVVDDHREIRELIAKLLAKDGFRVTTAADGRAMYKSLESYKINLIILDLMLPVEDGLSLCRQLRMESSDIPIIMLTAKGDEIDRVLGLEMGADDYIAKPFGSRELVARIKAVLRRSQSLLRPRTQIKTKRCRFKGWIFDTAKRELIDKDGEAIPLSTGEYDLLLVFVQHPHVVLSRDQLLDLAKGRNATPFDRSIDSQVSRLRRKIGDDGKDPKIIKTVWGGGYVFTPSVSME